MCFKDNQNILLAPIQTNRTQQLPSDVGCQAEQFQFIIFRKKETMKIDAVSVTSKDLRESTKFYQLLGFEFPEFGDKEKHIEPITKPGDVRLMIDDHDLIKDITGVVPQPPSHSLFAMLCDSPAQVDETVDTIKAHGYTVVKEPWDAFWGQRYAIVRDPFGYMIDLFARL
jgi:catechol 2,3-dioxygenase-like lactoylglutathione lyase family enzyme